MTLKKNVIILCKQFFLARAKSFQRLKLKNKTKQSTKQQQQQQNRASNYGYNLPFHLYNYAVKDLAATPDTVLKVLGKHRGY